MNYRVTWPTLPFLQSMHLEASSHNARYPNWGAWACEKRERRALHCPISQRFILCGSWRPCPSRWVPAGRRSSPPAPQARHCSPRRSGHRPWGTFRSSRIRVMSRVPFGRRVPPEGAGPRYLSVRGGGREGGGLLAGLSRPT